MSFQSSPALNGPCGHVIGSLGRTVRHDGKRHTAAGRFLVNRPTLRSMIDTGGGF